MFELTDEMLANQWVKDLLSTADPAPLSSLIEDRIRFSNTGPAPKPNEKKTDIITSLILHCEDDQLRSRIEEATACIIHKVKHGKTHGFVSDLLIGVSALVRQIVSQSAEPFCFAFSKRRHTSKPPTSIRKLMRIRR